MKDICIHLIHIFVQIENKYVYQLCMHMDIFTTA